MVYGPDFVVHVVLKEARLGGDVVGSTQFSLTLVRDFAMSADVLYSKAPVRIKRTLPVPKEYVK